MNRSSPGRASAFRALIETFLKERLEAKRDKLPDDDPKFAALASQYERRTWLADAARRVGQIQAVTHSLKPIHPDARGSNLYCAPSALPPRNELGSHVLGEDFAADVVGNAAALDVYKLLKLKLGELSLLDALLADDADALAALSDDAEEAAAWAEAFRALVQPRGTATSHTFAKQLYWLAEDDPLDDTHYHLLAPLYASSLAHRVFQTLNEDRFGEAAKAARQARRDNAEHPHGYAEYPSLAVQKLGGTKPQNISQLNSERGGNNYLLGSLPPQWKSRGILAPLSTDSVFPRFGRSPSVRKTIRELRSFLESDPPPTMETRNQRDAFIDALLDELVSFAAELQQALPQGWTLDEDCELVREEQLWLDPHRTEEDTAFRSDWEWMDWPSQIGKRFGNWLNNQLDKRLPLGEIEAREWAKELLLDEPNEASSTRRVTWAGRLHTMRRKLDAPTYIPTREGT